MASFSKDPIDRLVHQLFKEIGAERGECCNNPVTGAGFVWGVDPISAQKKAAARALRARKWFADNGPGDAPPLPFSHNIDDYRRAGGLTAIVGFYARSLRRLRYDVGTHPSFDDFACGLMAADLGLWDLRKDAALERRFPPRPLAGMTPGAYWAPPEEYERTMSSYRRQ